MLTVLVLVIPLLLLCCAPRPERSQGLCQRTAHFPGESTKRRGTVDAETEQPCNDGPLAHNTCTLGRKYQKGQRKGTQSRGLSTQSIEACPPSPQRPVHPVHKGLSTQSHACLWAGAALAHLLG